MDSKTRRAKIAELRIWAQLDKTADGQARVAVCDLAAHCYYLSDRLVDALDREIVELLEDYTCFARIVTESETQTSPVRRIQWNEHRDGI